MRLLHEFCLSQNMETGIPLSFSRSPWMYNSSCCSSNHFLCVSHSFPVNPMSAHFKMSFSTNRTFFKSLLFSLKLLTFSYCMRKFPRKLKCFEMSVTKMVSMTIFLMYSNSLSLKLLKMFTSMFWRINWKVKEAEKFSRTEISLY